MVPSPGANSVVELEHAKHVVIEFEIQLSCKVFSNLWFCPGRVACEAFMEGCGTLVSKFFGSSGRNEDNTPVLE